MKILIAFLFSLLSVTFSYAQNVGNGPYLPLNFSKFDFVGDSRTTLINVGGIPGIGYNGQSWFNQANALAGNPYILGLQQGGSGCRSDQFLSYLNIQPMLTSNSGWFVINFWGVNDVAPQTGNGLIASNACSSNVSGSFPYTNNNGVSVTQSNVGAVAAGNVITAAQLAMTAGKKVLIIEEPGATNTSTSSIGQIYDGNARLRAFAANYPGQVYFRSFNSTIWAPTSSATAIAFVTGCSVDGVHPSDLCGYLEGVVFNTWAAGLGIPAPTATDLRIANINNTRTTNPRQLVQNPLFNTTTGGSRTSCTTGTGSVPNGWTLSCAGTTTVNITSGADAGGFGNDITLAITCTAADTINFASSDQGISFWNLTDIFQVNITAAVSAGSSNFHVWDNIGVVTDQGNSASYGLYGGAAINGAGGPTTAYTYQLATQPRGVLPNSVTKSFMIPQFQASCSAAGGGTVTLSRASVDRLYQYNNGVFTGQ